MAWKQKNSSSDLSGLESGPWPRWLSPIMSVRGLDSVDDVQTWLTPKLNTLADPLSILNMQTAVDRIVQAFKADELICVYADFDLDGTSGLALMNHTLQGLGFKKWLKYQPKRLSEGYGFHASAVEDLKKQGVSLIITVDVGITSFEACEKAKQLGVDVIITDHHLPLETLPNAFCIVNPNQNDCKSDLGYLCGAGVAFYLARALKRAFTNDPDLPKTDWDLKDVLEFFTIGTLTDMVPLIKDNRALVKLGLQNFSKTNKPGLKALLKELNLWGRDLTSQDVAIRLAPKLNALSRLEGDLLPVDIMLCNDLALAESLIDQVLNQNSERVVLQEKAEKISMELLKDWQHKEFVFVASTEFHRGVIGLVATKLTQAFNRPAFVAAVDPEGYAVGSSRLPNGYEGSLVAALSSCEKQLTRFGGHAAAAGFELIPNKSEEFVNQLVQYFAQAQNLGVSSESFYDVTVQLTDINEQSMKWYDSLGPFGSGFEVPLLRFNRVLIQSVKELNGGHLKLELKDSLGQKIEALMFSPTKRNRDLAMSAGKAFDLLGEVQWNHFAGRKKLQLLVRELQEAEVFTATQGAHGELGV